MRIIDQDYYNTDGDGMMLIVEREDHCYAEASDAEGPFIGLASEQAVLPGAEWFDSPNEVIEAWYRTVRAGQARRPNVRADSRR